MHKQVSTYGIHPSEQLVQLFKEKPYQGADPDNAKVLIIGNDANYTPKISKDRFFGRILEYHSDGVKFWQRTGVHHPFLLPEYPFDSRMDGVKYHSNFRKLGFSPTYAQYFSFVELLHVPTIGMSNSNPKLFFDLLNAEHLNWLESLILSGDRKFVVVNQTLAKIVKKISKKIGVLGRLAETITGKRPQSVALETEDVTIFNGYSFSAPQLSDQHLRHLSGLMRRFLEDEISR